MGFVRTSLWVASQGAVSRQSTKQKVAAATLAATRSIAADLAMERWEREHAEREARWAAYQAAKASAS